MKQQLRVEIKGRNEYWRRAVMVEWEHHFPQRKLIAEDESYYLIEAAWLEDLRRVASECFSEVLIMADEMTDKKDQLSRRSALKGIAAGLGAASSLPILSNSVLGQQEHHHGAPEQEAKTKPAGQKAEPLKFFNASQMALITTISELIIPTDDHSPGAKAAGVPAFIDLMVNVSPADTK